MNEQIIDDELTRDDLLTITIEENLICTNNSNNGNVQSEIDNCGGISKDQIITDNKINILKNDDIINLVDGICIGGDNNLNNNYCISDGNDGNDNDNDDGGGGNVAIVEEAALAVVAAINGCGDGNSDSGVEIGNANNNNDLNIFKNNSEINLQRALSSSNNSGIGGASGASGSGSGNGGGYTSSSCGGFDEPIGDYVSCNSSMISFCSEIGDNNNNNNNIQKNNSINHQFNNNKNNDYCTSEGNSESSSIVGGPTISSSSSFRRNMSSASTRKKVILNDSLLINDKIMNTNNKNSLGKSTIKNRYENTVAKSRSRAASANRAAVAIINPTSKSSISPTPSSASSAAAPRNSRIDGSPSSSTIQNSNKNISIIHQGRSTPIKKLNKPDSLPTGLKDGLTQSIPNVVCPSAVATITRNQLNRTPSLNRNNRTSSGCTPTKSLDDGRWPLTNKTTSNTLKSQRSIGGRNVNSISNNNNNNNNQRFFNDAINSHENLIIKTKIGPISLDNYNDEKTINNIIDKYATLPRRRKEKSAEDLNNGTAVAGAAGRQSIRSNSASRDSMMTTSTYHSKGSPSVNNCTSNLNITKEQQIHPVTRQQSIHHPSISTTTTRNKKNLPKIKLYRETSSQTLITRKDVDDAFSNGCTRPIDINAIEMATKSSQVDIRDKQMESLELKLKKTNEHNTYLQSELTKRSQVILTIEQQLNRERDEKQAMHFELQKNTQRILGLLELTNVQTPPSSSSSVAASTTTSTVSQIPSNNPIGVNKLNNNNNNISGSKNSINNNSGEEQIIIIPQSSILLSSETNCDSLLMLESQIQLSGHVLEEKQSEIDMLHSFCRKLQIEMKRSLSVQQNLLEEKEVIEKESTELQDFLQDEKTALVDALKEIELENEENKEKIDKYTSDLERLREECRHLVRISEQRRHEYLGIQSKYNALESRSKELIVQQGTAVSGASKALAGLGARLDKLVEQLISSYNISEQELEDVIYHNEAYTTNSSSGDGSPDYDMMGCVNDPNNHHHQQQQNKLFKDNEQMDGGDGNGSLSPQRHQSFIVAVINAIKNAAVGNSMKYSMQHQRKDIDYHLGGGGCDIGNVEHLLNGNNQYINNNNNNNNNGEIIILNNGNNSSVCANNIKHNNNNNNNHQLQNKTSCDDSDSTDMLDSETEPCLMMENVLEDVQMPDTHSHNMVSSTCLLLKSNQTIIGNRDHQQQQQQQHQQSESQLSLPINSEIQQSLILNAKSPDMDMDMDMDKNEESINNLSQAIVNRQQIELHNSLMIRHNSEHSTSDDISVHESQSMDVPSIGEYCSAQALVNEVIDVDNLVTKLLKVLRIIQMDNDNCIQQLISDKNKLQLNKAEISEKLKDYEMLHLQLKNDLQDATHQLMVRGTDLANCKVELQRHRSEIDRLNVDVCNLSTLCTENKNNNINNNNNNNNCLIKSKEDIFSTLKSWHENGLIDERELISRLLSTCKDEIPILKQNLSEKEENLLNENDCNKNKQNSMKNLLTANWKTAMVETKRQYEAIDKALEILNNMQSIVQRYPELIDLQRQLEETNFNSITNLPLYSAILTASNNNNNNINEDDDNKNNNNNENNIITNLSDCGDENDAATPLNGNNIGGIKGNKNNGTTITTTKQQDMACQ